MKKGMLFVLAGLLALYFLIGLLLPALKTGTYQQLVTSNSDATMRIFINEKKWSDWWPGEKKADSLYSFQQVTYRIDKILLNGFNVTLFGNQDSAKASLQVVPVSMDSSDFIWNWVVKLPNNPLSKTMYYAGVQHAFEKNIRSLTRELKKYFDQQQNVYGMNIVRKTVTDSTLVSLKKNFDHYPSTEEIYTLIDSVKNFIRKKGGAENNYPMLNIHMEGPGLYEAMVGIPTKIPLTAEGGFTIKHMVLGYILEGEIKGGVSTVLNAEQQMTNYVLDHKKLSPAIPFQSLVTNRLQQKDSTQWITRLYYPIFY